MFFQSLVHVPVWACARHCHQNVTTNFLPLIIIAAWDVMWQMRGLSLSRPHPPKISSPAESVARARQALKLTMGPRGGVVACNGRAGHVQVTCRACVWCSSCGRVCVVVVSEGVVQFRSRAVGVHELGVGVCNVCAWYVWHGGVRMFPGMYIHVSISVTFAFPRLATSASHTTGDQGLPLPLTKLSGDFRSSTTWQPTASKQVRKWSGSTEPRLPRAGGRISSQKRPLPQVPQVPHLWDPWWSTSRSPPTAR